MDIRALIDFNKYTLLLATGSFGYAMEKEVFSDPNGMGFLDGLIVAVLLISVIFGILMYAACVSRLHSGSEPDESLEKTISALGILHAICLILGLFAFSVNVMAKQPALQMQANTVISKPNVNECQPLDTQPRPSLN